MKDLFDDVRDVLSSMDSAVVCFSGGLDSTALMNLCRETMGDGAVALYVSTPMESGRTVDMVRMVSEHLGFGVTVRHMDDRISGLVLQNRQNRCYVCKKAIYSEAVDLAYSLGIRHVICGDNADDDPGTRPGMKAAKEMMVRSPFREAGIGRKDIEEYVRSLELPFAMVKETCLLMRVPVGVEADEELLDTIGEMESEIRSVSGIGQVRARLSDDTIRVQTSGDEIDTMLAHGPEIVEICRRRGFGTELVRTGYNG